MSFAEKMPFPKISVIMSAFNAEKYIGEAVKSILNQTFTDFELIVIDDGSTDRTLEIVKQVGHSTTTGRLRIISNHGNLGLAKSLNIGIAEAYGEYIARQDADDISLPERLEKQFEYMQCHPDIALLGTAMKFLHGNGEIKEHQQQLQNPLFADLLKSNHFVHGSVMIRKRVLDVVGGYNEIFYSSEDYELWLRITKRFPAANLPEPLYILRLHAGSMTSRYPHLLWLYHILAQELHLGKVSDEVLLKIRKKGVGAFYSSFSDKEKIIHHRRIAKIYQRSKRYQEALEEWRKVFKLQKLNRSAIRWFLVIKSRLFFSKQSNLLEK